MAVVGLIRTGNWRSVQNALEHLGAEVTFGPEGEWIVIPGQGSMKSCMDAIEPVRSWLELARSHGIPILGICAGMHAMCAWSEEGDVKGLGWFPHDVRKLPDKRLPRMGWETTLRGDMYFCHSYNVFDLDPNDPLPEWPSFIWRDNLVGVQFHPEKSQQAGLAFLKEFLDWRP